MEDTIKKILSEIVPEFDEYSGNDMIKDELLDSMQILEIIAEVEEEFKIEIPAEEMVGDNFRSVEAIKNIIIRL
jgi:D-alanine--poly(phosphoribitol) ligase subunit 2